MFTMLSSKTKYNLAKTIIHLLLMAAQILVRVPSQSTQEIIYIMKQ